MNKINDLNRHNARFAEQLAAASSRVLTSGWFALGPEVSQFEQNFAAYCEAAHAIGVANGTEALELALRAVGVEAGDEVITVANAGFYTSTAVLRIGAQPVYCDIDAEFLLLDAADLPRCITDRTKAIVVTHLFGMAADVDAVRAIAAPRGIAVIEDCAQAHGARLHGRRVGSLADIAAFSFFPTKNLGALGDGGAVTTNSDELATRLRQLRQYGWSKKYYVERAGACNSRLDELQAALLDVKLPQLDAMNSRRREIAQHYNQLLSDKLGKPYAEDERYVGHLYVVRCPDRAALQAHLQQHDIGTDIHYPVLDCDQAIWRGQRPAVSLPVSRAAVAQILTLPCFPEMTEEEVRHVANVVNAGLA